MKRADECCGRSQNPGFGAGINSATTAYLVQSSATSGTGSSRLIERVWYHGTRKFAANELGLAKKSGCGAAWLARLTGGQKVAGSNPVTPTEELAGN